MQNVIDYVHNSDIYDFRQIFHNWPNFGNPNYAKNRIDLYKMVCYPTGIYIVIYLTVKFSKQIVIEVIMCY